MTVKQIAESVGQTDRSVRNWVARLAEKSSVIAEKTSVSSPMKPADYTMDEVCQIIEEGMGPEAAGVYRANAVYSKMEQTQQKPKLTGALVNALLKARDHGALTDGQFQAMIGAPQVVVNTPAPLELPGRISKQAYAVEMKQRQKEEQKKLTESKNPTLDGIGYIN